MKKIIFVSLFIVLTLVGTSCSNEEIVYDNNTSAVEEDISENNTTEVVENIENNNTAEVTENDVEDINEDKKANRIEENTIDKETGLTIYNIGEYVVNIDEAEVDYSHYLDDIEIVEGKEYKDDYRSMTFKDGICITTKPNSNITIEDEYFVKGNHIYIREPYFSQQNFYIVYEIRENGKIIYNPNLDNEYVRVE